MTNTKVDWTKVPAGTMIRVRECDRETWSVREFIHHYPIANAFICKNAKGDDGSYIKWYQAELIEEQPSVQFEGDNVRIPVTTYLEITASEYGLIQKLYPSNKISIIKFIREVHKFGLVETKKICDSICGLN